jgi:transcriptional regulator with XRE-family HTH domain
MRINSKTLRLHRKNMNFSLDELASKSGVHKATIHRIENGKMERSRNHTIAVLAKALKIEPEVLSREPEKADGTESFFDAGRSQLPHRISHNARNAMALVAKRYGIGVADIVEFAPFLFHLAAEESLSARRERLSRLTDAWLSVSEIGSEYSHINQRIGYDWKAEEMAQVEERSIGKNDIRGSLFESQEDIYDIQPDDYDDEINNPFVKFLRGKLANLERDWKLLGVLEDWSHRGSPTFTICGPDALEYFGGDEDIASDVLSGRVALHELPKELRAADQLSGRLIWATEKIEQNRIEASKYFKELGIEWDLGDE